MNTRIRFVSQAMILAMAVIGASSQLWADDQVRLRARQNKIINGFQAELRGDYREESGPSRLNAELEKINIPVGAPVAFCLVQNGVKSLIGVGHVVRVGGIPVAQIELEANDGDSVPKVFAGDILESHQRTAAPFIAHPNCGSPILLSAPFRP